MICQYISYRLPYAEIFGGATILTPSQMKRINGFPNVFFGWGGEDDNISARLRTAGYGIMRYPSTISRYSFLLCLFLPFYPIAAKASLTLLFYQSRNSSASDYFLLKPHRPYP